MLINTFFERFRKFSFGGKSRLFLTSLFLCLLTGIGSADGQIRNTTAGIDALLAEQTSDTKPGAAILVIENGKIVFQKGYGLADVRTGRSITSNTAFDLASVSKQFTALAVLQLAEKEKISLSDSLRKFFPEFPVYADKIAVRHLLNHTSGLPDYIELFLKSGHLKEDGGPGGFEPTNADVIKILAAQKEPYFAAGEKWEYSNSGYALLAKIVEKASGKSFPKYVSEHILKPLGMTQTVVYSEERPEAANRAVSYRKKGEVYEDVDYTPLNLIYGDGSINSTIEDLSKWDAALYTEKLVKAETLRLAFAAGKLNDGKATNYGFGWFVKNTPHGLETSHSGGWAGFRNFIVRYPEKRLSVIVLSNSAEFNPVQKGLQIARLFLDGNGKSLETSAALMPTENRAEPVSIVIINDGASSLFNSSATKNAEIPVSRRSKRRLFRQAAALPV